MSEAANPRTHNLPPIIAPLPDEMSDDLKRRFPELDTRLAEFEKALETYKGKDGKPSELSLKDEETAGALQDLLGQMKKFKSLLAAHKKDEKKPWDGLVKVVQNFFTTRDEKADKLLELWQPVHEAYLALKRDEARRLAEEEAERQRKKEEAARAAALAAQEEQRKAEQAAEAARKKEEENRLAAEKAEKERLEAEERAAVAKAEEERLARVKREREKAEKEKNTANIRDIKANMKSAERLHDVAESDGATEAETQNLDMLVRAGGIIGNLASEIFYSALLDDEQKTYLTETRARLGVLRQAFNDRINKREQKKREKLAAEAAAREEALAAERKAAQEKADGELAKARQTRLDEEAGAARAREEQKTAQEATKTAKGEARQAEQGAKAAGREARDHGTEADRASNRADRAERRLENDNDGPLRGELGTVGSLTGRWAHYIDDENALRAVCGPLAEHFNSDDLKGAVYRWMGAHRQSFVGERVEPKELPGVHFAWEEGGRIA